MWATLGSRDLPTLTAVLLGSSSPCLLGVLRLMRLLLRLERILSAAFAVSDRWRCVGAEEVPLAGLSGTAGSSMEPVASACMLSGTNPVATGSARAR